jgi:hypothetical protein
MFRVFVSSTSADLDPFRQAVKDVVLTYDWHPVMMEHFETAPEHTVAYCRQRVLECNLVLLLVAFRRGSPAPADKGGDGVHPYTWYEVEAAQEHGIPIRVLMAKETWPGNLWDQDDGARRWVLDWRRQLSRIAAFFGPEAVELGVREPLPMFRQLVRKALSDHKDWLAGRVAEALGPGPDGPRLPAAARSVLGQLQPLLGQAVSPARVVRSAYREAHPEGVDDLPGHGDAILLLAEAARRLARFPLRARDGGHPLADFGRRLAAAADGTEQDALRRWAGEAARTLAGAEPPPAATPAAAPGPGAVGNFHVVACFEPATQPGQYKVRAVAYEPGGPVELPLEKVVWTEHNRRAMLGSLWRQAHKRKGARRLVLEFVVPRSLLGRNLDEWEADLGPYGVGRVGCVCPVVVRPLERRLPEADDGLRNRWPLVQPYLARLCRVAEAVALEETEPPRALWVSEHRDGTRLFPWLDPAKHVVSAILERAPAAERPGRVVDPFGALLVSGIPIMAWPRKGPRAGGPAREELARLFEGGPLDGLPGRLHEHRCREKKLALTLVWDDPSRPAPGRADEPPLFLEGQGPIP